MNHLYQFIETIRNKPQIHLGSCLSITALYTYFSGFQAALYELKEKEEIKQLLPLPFDYFHDFVANHYHWRESTLGWQGIILKEANGDEERGLWTFFELFDTFKALAIRQCHVAALQENHIHHHYTSKYAPKRGLPPDLQTLEPLYLNPREVYVIELAQQAGFICLTNAEAHHRIFPNQANLEAFLHSCFGLSLHWRRIKIDNIEFSMEHGY